MNLVQFLAAGVNGAASGSATFFLRGTASSAAAVLYNDFEGTTQPGTNVITLDANGAAEVYCDAYVDVELKTSAGVTLRTVTVGNADSLVEVQSTSFKGTDYDGSPANTVGEPITLRALLNKWITSAGAPDWQVLVNSVATNLQAALSGVSGLIFNVKDPAYGALGDGVTDDTTAIIAANTAAAGKPVYFPPGTYKITTLSLGTVTLNWFGAGLGASIISGTTESDLIALTDSTSTAWKNFTGLSFTSSGTYTRLFSFDNGQNVSFSRCSFDSSQCTSEAIQLSSDAGLSKLVISDCDFTLGASTHGIRNAASTGARHISIRGCNFTLPSGFTGRVLRGPDFIVDNCRFDGSAVVSGTYRMIDAEDGGSAGRYVGNFSGNKFIDGGSTGFVFELTSIGSNCDFSEDGNTFIGYTAPDATSEKGQTYEITDADSGVPGDIRLGSRKGRAIHIASNATTLTASACLEAELVVIEHTGSAGNLAVTIPALIPGLFGRVVVYNDDGVERTVTFIGSNGFGCFVTAGTLDDDAMSTTPAGDMASSCGYVTTARSDGTFESLICGMYDHEVAV